MPFLLLCVLQRSFAGNYNVMQFGAKGDGKTDDTKAFERAWEEVCNDVGPSSRLTIPLFNTFLVSPINFQGPCKPPLIHFQILGSIMAPRNPGSWNGCETGAWLLFYNVNGLLVDGGGLINGRGKAWWTKHSSHIKEEFKCDVPPTALHFESCSGLRLRKLKHRNSPRNHIGLSRCSNSSISYLDIAAPANSPNTDGIDISLSTQIRLHHLNIKTGTSSSRRAMNFDCSKREACSGILLNHINITSAVEGEDTIAYCNNAYGTTSFTTPPASCLLH
ncbi:hypothetical protein R6Q57_004036 [Mikania cordata]